MIYKENKILLGQTYKGFGNLGGKIHKNDKSSLYHIGIRELLEELFDWEELSYRPKKNFITKQLLDDIIYKFISFDRKVKTYKKANTTFIFLPIKTFNDMLDYLSKNERLTSVYYKHGLPKNDYEVIHDRFPSLRGFDGEYKEDKHFEEYSKLLEKFSFVDYVLNKETTTDSIKTYLKNLSKRIGQIPYKKIVEGKLQPHSALYRPETILFGIYNKETTDMNVVKDYLRKNIVNPTLPMEIIALDWIDTNKLKTEDRRLVSKYGIGLANYISDDIEIFKTQIKE